MSVTLCFVLLFFAESSTVNSHLNSPPRRLIRAIKHEPGLRFTLENGVIRPQTRLAAIRPIIVGSFIIGMNVDGHFYPIYKDGESVEVLNSNHNITRPLNRDLHVQYRHRIHPSSSGEGKR